MSNFGKELKAKTERYERELLELAEVLGLGQEQGIDELEPGAFTEAVRKETRR